MSDRLSVIKMGVLRWQVGLFFSILFLFGICSCKTAGDSGLKDSTIVEDTNSENFSAWMEACESPREKVKGFLDFLRKKQPGSTCAELYKEYFGSRRIDMNMTGWNVLE